MATVKELASKMYDAFETATRTNGEEFSKLKDGSPEWMTTAIHAAHGDMLPEDYRYKTIREACGFISDNIENYSEEVELIDVFSGDVDVYNNKLLQWVSSNLTRMSYVDDGVEEMGFTSLSQALMYGQSMERREIISLLLESLQGIAEEMEEEEESSDD